MYKYNMKGTSKFLVFMVILVVGMMLSPIAASAWGFGSWFNPPAPTLSYPPAPPGYAFANVRIPERGDAGKLTTQPSANFPGGKYKVGETFTIVTNAPQVMTCNNGASNMWRPLVIKVVPYNNKGSKVTLISSKVNTPANFAKFTYRVDAVDPSYPYFKGEVQFSFKGQVVSHTARGDIFTKVNEIIAKIPGTVKLIAKKEQADLNVSPTDPQVYNTTRTYTVTGGSGTGAISDRLISGNATRVGPLTYLATSGTGSYTFEVTKGEDSLYNPITKRVTIQLKKADQSPINVGPTTEHVFYTIRNFTVTGGNGTGEVTSKLISGKAKELAELKFLAESGTGTYDVKFTKDGDSNYNPVSKDVTIQLAKADQSLLTIDKNIHVYNEIQTYVIGGGNGTGAITDVLSSGQDKVTRLGDLEYKANSGTGDYTINVTKANDENYNAKTQAFNITLERAEQAGFTVTPLDDQIYLEERTYTFSGGSGAGSVSDEFVSGLGERIEPFKYKAIGGDGMEYKFQVTKDGDENYKPKTEVYPINLKSLNASLSANRNVMMMMSNKEEVVYELEIRASGDLIEDNFEEKLTTGKIEVFAFEGSTGLEGSGKNLIVSIPDKVENSNLIPVTLKLDMQPIEPLGDMKFTLKLTDFSYENNGYALEPNELEIKFWVQTGVDAQ